MTSPDILTTLEAIGGVITLLGMIIIVLLFGISSKLSRIHKQLKNNTQESKSSESHTSSHKKDYTCFQTRI